MSLFNEQFFWEELREHSDPKKRNIIRKYEAMFGSLKDMDIRQTRFCRNYLSKFNFPFRVNTPEELEDDFDWDLLQRLIAGSFSSEMTLHVNQEWLENPTDDILVDVHITVKSGDQQLEKRLDELWSFQILRLFEIYIEEQMNLLITAYDTEDNEDDDEVECDVSQIQPVTDEEDDDEELRAVRKAQIQHFKQQIESVYKEIEKYRADKESQQQNEALERLLNALEYSETEQQDASQTSHKGGIQTLLDFVKCVIDDKD